MPDAPQATATPTTSATPRPVPTTVQRVSAKKATVRKNRPVPPGDGRIASLEASHRQHTAKLADFQRQLAETQADMKAAHKHLGELQQQTTRLRFTVPEAKVPLSAAQVQEAIKASPAQWFECLRDFNHGHLKLKSTAQICAQQYRNLHSFVRVGLQLVTISDPNVAA